MVTVVRNANGARGFLYGSVLQTWFGPMTRVTDIHQYLAMDKLASCFLATCPALIEETMWWNLCCVTRRTKLL
jgi:hypothetical protein